FVALAIVPPFPVHLDLAPFGKGRHHRRAHAVQAAAHLISLAVELPAGVELGHHHFQRRPAHLGVGVDGDAAAVVVDADAAVGAEDHVHLGTGAAQRFIDAVVEDLVDEVMKAARPGGTDVHPRTAPDSFESFEDLNLTGIVLALVGHLGHASHDLSPVSASQSAPGSPRTGCAGTHPQYNVRPPGAPGTRPARARRQRVAADSGERYVARSVITSELGRPPDTSTRRPSERCRWRNSWVADARRARPSSTAITECSGTRWSPPRRR